MHWNQKVTNVPNRNAFGSRLKCLNSMSGCCNEAGKLCQILGPVTAKLLSPSRVFVLGTVSTLTWAEQSCRHPESVVSEQSSDRYGGAWPHSKQFGNKSGQLLVDLLFQRKPMQTIKNWQDVVTSTGSCQKACRCVQDWLQMPEQNVTYAIE